MKLNKLMDELDRLRRYAGRDARVVIRILDEDEESSIVDVQAVRRERTDDGVRIVLDV